MQQKFDIILLEEVWEFFDALDEKVKNKIIYNIDKSRYVNDPELFKKLETDIWEFRTKYSNLQFRIFAFWDKEDNTETLVIATHGIIKKTDKVPKKEFEKARVIMKLYFEQKNKK
ncbi:MAG: type II toxin-antitoxin system RelE/ParE family toxin [Bacteroidetes bacterium]|nr:MAG: type II toxin-antitoxin system RelE/ParE family toxin [Bacteroidota bacterium]